MLRVHAPCFPRLLQFFVLFEKMNEKWFLRPSTLTIASTNSCADLKEKIKFRGFWEWKCNFAYRVYSMVSRGLCFFHYFVRLTFFCFTLSKGLAEVHSSPVRRLWWLLVNICYVAGEKHVFVCAIVCTNERLPALAKFGWRNNWIISKYSGIRL